MTSSGHSEVGGGALPPELVDATRGASDLAEARTLLRTLVENVPDLVYVKDVAGQLVLVNDAGLRHAGAADEHHLLGKTDFDLFPEELAARYRADDEAVIRTGEPLVDRAEPSVDAGGNALWFSTTKVPVRDGSGAI